MSRIDESFEGIGTGLRLLLEDDEPGAAPRQPWWRPPRGRAAIARVATALTRFDPASELSRLNADPRPEVPAGPELRALVQAGRAAAERTEGLVDPTALDGTCAHHLVDPATGRPGVDRPDRGDGTRGERRRGRDARHRALLAGPLGARRVLRPLGGLLVREGGAVELIAPTPVVRLPRPRRTRRPGRRRDRAAPRLVGGRPRDRHRGLRARRGVGDLGAGAREPPGLARCGPG